MAPIYCFYGIPKCRNDWVSASCTSSWALFCLFWIFVFCLFLMCLSSCFYYILFSYFSIEAYYLTRKRKGVDPEGMGGKKEPGGVAVWKMIIIIYYVRKTIFNKKKQNLTTYKFRGLEKLTIDFYKNNNSFL